MREISLGDVQDGMILARDAVDPFGNQVLPVGTVINAQVRSRLKMGRVAKVFVSDSRRPTGVGIAPGGLAGESEDDPSKSDSVIVQESLLRLARMFNEHRENPLMRELCRLAIKSAQERLIRV